MALGGGFWRLAASAGTSNLADGVVQVALPLLALQLTRSPLLVAGVAVASRLPWLLFALLAGVVADRVDRRRLMVGVQLGRALSLAGVALLALAGLLELWHLYLLALALGVAETLFDTAAQSVLPAVVTREQLPRANSRLYGVEVTTNTFVGPPLGGLLVAVATWSALGAGAAAYVLAALALLAVGGRFRPAREGPRTSVRQDLVEGLGYLRTHALLGRLALLVGGVSVTAGAANAVFPVFAVAPGPMGLSEAQYGLLLTAVGAGAVLASLTAERVVDRLGPARCLRWALVAIAAVHASPLLVQPVAVALGFGVSAFFIVVWNVITVSLRQSIVPDRLLGRVNSAYRLLAWGAGPLGAVAGGVVAEVSEPRVVFVLAAVGCLALLLGMRPLDDTTLRAVGPDGDGGTG